MILFIVLLIFAYLVSCYFSNYSNYNHSNHEQYEAPPKIGRIWKNCDSPDGMNDVQQCSIPTEFNQPSWFNTRKNYDMGIFKITN